MCAAELTSLTDVSPVLTERFLHERLTEWFRRPVAFTHYQYVGETGKGDSFMSELIRIKIFGKDDTGNEQAVQLIVKTLPKSACRRLTYRLDEFFRNEIIFYQRILPELLKFQAERNPKDPFHHYTKLFAAHSDGINDVLALEDVSLLNYGSPTRQEGIDFQHCKVVLETFAKFHALSFAMRDQKPQLFEEISKLASETYYRADLWPWYEKFWKRLCGIAIDAVEKEYPQYSQQIRDFASPEIYPKLIAAVQDVTHGVISHGDSWTNNFLFRYEGSRRPLDAKMIDFQLARCASPVLDVAFFVYACTTEELRREHYDGMLALYHARLCEQVAALGSDPGVYKWDVFMDDVKRYSFFGLAFSFESTPFIVLDPEDAPCMTMEGEEKLNIDDIWQVKPLKSQRARLREADNFVHCLRNGYIPH